MKQITEVVFIDGTKLSLSKMLDIKSVDHFKEQYRSEKKHKEIEVEYYASLSYKRQFMGFEEEILENLNKKTVKGYAEDELGLVDEDDVDEKELRDFSDSEIINYCKLNGLIEDVANVPNNLIAQSIFEDIPKLFQKYSAIELSEIVDGLLKN